MYIDVDNERVVRAFAECITEAGAMEIKIDQLARRLGSSRAGLYRQFGSWPQMIMFGYEAMLEWVDVEFERPGQDRRVELETWWERVVMLLGSPVGRGVLKMRALAELHCGTHELEELETTQLRRFKRWCGASAAATRACWSMIRLAAHPRLTADQRLELREIAWLVLGGNGTSAGTVEALVFHSLM